VSKAAVPGSPSAPQVAAPKGPAVAGQAPINRQQHFAPVLPPKNYQPPVLFIDQPKFDFGDVIKGEVVTHRFEIENKGGSPLIVQKVKPSCGCTLVDEATMDKVIAPGAKGGFELKIETSRLGVGRQQKYADVASNDPKQSQFRVFIGGKIDSLLKVEPEMPKIHTVKGRGPGTTEITLTKNITGDMKVVGAKSQSGRLLVDMKEVQPNSLYKLAVTTNYGPKETQSYYNEQIQIDVQMGERKLTQEISLPVQVKDRIDITPRSVYFKRTDFQALKDKGTPVVKAVDLRPSVEEPYKFKITNTKLDDPDSFFKVNLETLKDGREYRLNVTVDKLPPETPAADGKPAASKSMKGNVTLTTDDPMMPEIVIRCIAFF